MTTASPPPASAASRSGWGLGLDAGGTHTRWALADAAGQLRASGELPSMSGQQLASPDGQRALMATLRRLADAVGRAAVPDSLPLHAVLAGITGFDAQTMPQWCGLAAEALHLPQAAVRAMSDIELTCSAAFPPGQGVVLIAGTGSIAAHVDADGVLHRAGGRGAVIDDAGGGHWIACQALQHTWRMEDAAPGAWSASPLARALFAHIGGNDWPSTRAWVYGASRGELGSLAQAVAQAADADPAAAAILAQAGVELARLVRALQERLGVMPLALAGRVWDLHPTVESSLRTALQQASPRAVEIQRLQTPAHHAAARLAATIGC